MERCQTHEMLNCAICNGDDRRFRQSTATSFTSFPARYPGTCHSCGASLEVGQIIHYKYSADAGKNVVICEDCA
jgi:hypothetical protein